MQILDGGNVRKMRFLTKNDHSSLFEGYLGQMFIKTIHQLTMQDLFR